MFSFNPLSDEKINELQNRALLIDGIYSFVVRGVEQQQSQKTGSPMLKVTLGVTTYDNNVHFIIGYITTSERMMFKLKHFCETLGLEDKYTAGSFKSSDCINLPGKVKITTQKGTPKPDGSGFYPDKNAVKDYVTLDLAKPAPLVDPKFNDDVPF